MPSELLASKLFIPPLRPNLVLRPRLVQLLHEGLDTKRKITLISAPAGFGKTTLVVDWLEQIDFPAVWLSLDEADNDLPRFLAYLAAAFQQVDGAIGVSLLSALQSPRLPAVEVILTGLINEIASRKDPLILVLDDYHLLAEADVLEAMGFLLEHQPQQLHLVLTTREDPDLPLARLRARDQLNEIRAGDLRFTRGETDNFFRSVMNLSLSEQDVVVLESRTEGWAAGLQLAGLSMQKQTNLKSFIADFSGSHRHILDYLTGEVIQQQPEDIQTFLLQTAILDRLTGPLCDSLTQRNDSDRVLAQLEHANLFLIPLDEERRWYRYHHLFADLLRSQLARVKPEWIPQLHQRASQWFEENGDIQAAVEHALRDPDQTKAAHLIEQYAFPKLYQGEVTMVLGWFDRLPEAIMGSAPMLCIGKAWALALMQRSTRRGAVERALLTAEQALDRVTADEALRNLVAGHAASVQAFLLQTPALTGDDPQTLIALSLRAQQLLPEDEKAIRSVNSLNIGIGYMALADLESASRAFHQTLEDGLSGGNLYAAIYGPINLVVNELLKGHLREALRLCETNIERFNQILDGQNFPPIGALFIQKGSILVELDQLEEAEKALTEGLDLIRWTGEYEAHKMGYTALARLRAIQGNQPAMLEAVKTLEESWPEGAGYAQTLRRRLLMRHWPADPDVQQDARTWLGQEGTAFGALVVINSVDSMSEAYFESNLGKAHVLAGLLRENAGVYPAGAYPVEEVQDYLKRQGEFAEEHKIVSWVVAVAIVKALLFQAAGKKDEALKALEMALTAAAPTGLFRSFVDEGEPMLSLLEGIQPQLTPPSLLNDTKRLADAIKREYSPVAPPPITLAIGEEIISDRELEVLRCLASGLTYPDIAERLIISLNTVRYHVKSMYSKLGVSSRAEAIAWGREKQLL